MTRYSTVPDECFGQGQTMPEWGREKVFQRLKRVFDWSHRYVPTADWDAAGGLDDREKELATLLIEATEGIKRGKAMVTDMIDLTNGKQWTDAEICKIDLLCMGVEVCQQSLGIALAEMAKTGLVTPSSPTMLLDPSRPIVDGVVE